MEKFLEAQRRGSLIIAFLSSFTGVLLLVKTFHHGFWSFILAALSAYVLSRVASWFHFLWLQHRIYNNDLHAFMEDAKGAFDHFTVILNKADTAILQQKLYAGGKLNLAAISPFMVIGGPEKHIANYMDAKIYDWLDMVGQDGIKRRFNYHSVATKPEHHHGILPEGCIIIQPGIIYQVDETSK